jgi:YbgC/YbaW family acyl-CoA thioester hydrolase
MKFTYKIKTNWHDTDANRCVRPSKIVEYMQETANRQCESSGLPLEKLRDEKGLAFILGAISVNIYKPLHAYEEIEVRTWCKEAKSYIFMRYFDILRGGELIAEASSTWVLIDINTKNMVRASNFDFLGDKFYYDEPVDPTALLPKAKIAKDAIMTEVGNRKIMYSDIDYNMHMNNTRYPDMVCDYLSEMTDESQAYRVSALSLSYLKESHLGATLTVTRSDRGEDGTVSVRTLNESGETCLEAVVGLELI